MEKSENAWLLGTGLSEIMDQSVFNISTGRKFNPWFLVELKGLFDSQKDSCGNFYGAGLRLTLHYPTFDLVDNFKPYLFAESNYLRGANYQYPKITTNMMDGRIGFGIIYQLFDNQLFKLYPRFEYLLYIYFKNQMVEDIKPIPWNRSIPRDTDTLKSTFGIGVDMQIQLTDNKSIIFYAKYVAVSSQNYQLGISYTLTQN